MTFYSKCLVIVALAVLAVTYAGAQKISWRRAKEGIDCATDSKFMCGRVKSVHDGDSLRIRPDAGESSSVRARSVPIRLLQLDAPELRQAYGPTSRDALARLLPVGSRVCVVSPGRDRYHRVLGFVCRASPSSSSEDLDVNAEMLAKGHAWCYHNRCNPKYAAAIKAARNAKLGLWSSASKSTGGGGGDEDVVEHPVAPWVFRRRERRRHRHHRDGSQLLR